MENTPPHSGVISRIVSLASGKNDRPVTYGFFPWSRRVPESKRYLEEFNEGLSELRETGRLEDLITTSLPGKLTS